MDFPESIYDSNFIQLSVNFADSNLLILVITVLGKTNVGPVC